MLFDDYSNPYQIMMESYIGRTPNLKKAQLELEKIVVRINNFYTTISTTKTISFTQECKEFERLVSKEFGTSIKLNFTPIEYAVGALAYTWNSSFFFNFAKVEQNFNETGKIISHQRLVPITITIGYALIHDYKVNAEELMAIILHEIGHNIQKYCILDTIFIPIMISNRILSGVYGFIDRGLSVLEGLPVLNQAAKGIKWVDNVFANITGNRLGYVISLLNVLMRGPEILIRFVDPLRHINGYAAERYSDSMAVAYGYGPALATGLLKIHPQTSPVLLNKLVYSNPVTAFIDTMVIGTVEICFMITMQGVHPNTQHRIENALRKCRRDLENKDFPPSEKKNLEKDLRTLERIHKDYLNAEDAKRDEVVQFYRQTFERYGINPLRNIALRDYYEDLEI